MFRDFLLFVKHPYAAGIIAVIWFGSVALIAMDRELPIVSMVIINMGASFLIAMLGFRSRK